MIRRTRRAALEFLGAENRLERGPGFESLERTVDRGLRDFTHVFTLRGGATSGFKREQKGRWASCESDFESGTFESHCQQSAAAKLSHRTPVGPSIVPPARCV